MAMEYEDYMRLALSEAQRAASMGEVPVGAVMVDEKGEIIARDHNAPVSTCDPAGHAEIMVLRQAGQATGNYRLTGTTLYVTVEPCCMCAGAIVHARVSKLVFGAWDQKSGACGSLYDIVRDSRLNHTVEVIPGVLAQECASIMREFFKKRRQRDGAA